MKAYAKSWADSTRPQEIDRGRTSATLQSAEKTAFLPRALYSG